MTPVRDPYINSPSNIHMANYKDRHKYIHSAANRDDYTSLGYIHLCGGFMGLKHVSVVHAKPTDDKGK